MRKIVFLLSALTLADCSASPEMIYLRTDGQEVATNPSLREQLDRDRLTCEGDTDCMAIKGYVSVSKDRAAAKQHQLATIAAQNAEREAVAVLPPPIPTKPHKTAIKQHKSNPPAITVRPSQD